MPLPRGAESARLLRLSPVATPNRAQACQALLVEVIHVTDQAWVDEAFAVFDKVNALLSDSGYQKLSRNELGGNGHTHDWRISGLY
jgi:hypothetical protein